MSSVFLHASMKEKINPFFLSLCHMGEKFWFSYCFLCMDNCFKLYLIFTSLVIGTHRNCYEFVLSNYEMDLSLKKNNNPTKQTTKPNTKHHTHKPPNPHSNQPIKQMLSLLSFYGCVTRTCMLLISKDNLLCSCNTGSLFVFSRKEEILKILNWVFSGLAFVTV